MRHFTQSPYEGLMRQKPEAGRIALPPKPPSEGRCKGCPYGSARPCIGICLQELSRKKKKPGQETENGRKEHDHGKEIRKI